MKERLLNRIREKREQHGLTQAELAHRIGVSRKTVNTIENLVFSPSALLAIKLAKELGSTVEELFWIDDDVSPRPG
ncbi:helix-turn-helix transcriptional regulator [Novosphingobium sp. RD2P27]|uniref:Helix-turn-helix transcriptional regulator n=1 Tax=Novosphingobium kalidii TaxID=3230299 RepID=A0ABV2CX83_9SPHN